MNVALFDPPIQRPPDGGNGEVCVGCDLVIDKNQFIMEGIGEAMKAVQIRVRCFYYWDLERRPPNRPTTTAA